MWNELPQKERLLKHIGNLILIINLWILKILIKLNLFLYRKAAQKWHPDNFQGDQKKIAEKKFIDIAAAKEVLTDEG